MSAFPVDRLQLEPVARSDTGPIGTIDTLGNNALYVKRGARVEQVTRIPGKRGNRDPALPGEVKLFEQPTALAVRARADGLVVEHKQVERDERDVPAARGAEVRPESVDRASGLRDQLTIEHQAPTEVGQCLEVVDPVGDVAP